MSGSTDDTGAFEAALAFWSTWSSEDVDRAGLEDRLDEAEQTSLRHRPRSLGEAAAQLSVVIESMVGGGRSDGQDIEAVRRAQALMREFDRRAALN